MTQKQEEGRTKQVETKRPLVKVSVLITKDDQVLLMKRNGAHGDVTWSTPGRHLEFGESLEACAIRSVKEEMTVTIKDLAFRAITNDLFENESIHFITIWMEGSYSSGEPPMQATNEMPVVGWFSWGALPEPLFLPLENLLIGRCHPALWNFNE